MAVSLGFGVLFATLITLVLVPTAYMILDDVGRTMRRVFGGYRPAPDVGVNRVWKVDAGPPLWRRLWRLLDRSGSLRYDSRRPPAGHAGGKAVRDGARRISHRVEGAATGGGGRSRVQGESCSRWD